jgi:hypothetical protein
MENWTVQIRKISKQVFIEIYQACNLQYGPKKRSTIISKRSDTIMWSRTWET